MTLPAVFNDFKKDCKIKNAIMDFSRNEKEFLTYVYCLEKDINFNTEKKRWKIYILKMDCRTNHATDWCGGKLPPRRK